MNSTERIGRMHRPRVAASLAGVLLAWTAASAAAQERPTRIDVAGRALDSMTRQPIANVYIGLIGTRRTAYTDENGGFKLSDVPSGRQWLAVEILGYAPDTLAVAVTDGMQPVELLLKPDPIVLAGLQVMSDRLVNRRRSVATSVRAYDATSIRSSGVWDLKDFVRNRTFTRPCPSLIMGETCVVRRGRVIAPAVYINDARVVGGIDMLMGLPPEEVYLLEVYSGGLQIRVYTNWYAERLASGRIRLPPLIFY